MNGAVRALGAGIAGVLALAATVVAVEVPRDASRAAAPPAPAPQSRTVLPATVRHPVAVPTHAVTPTHSAPKTAPVATWLSTAWGVDVSWPQCGPTGMPHLAPGFAVVGVNAGKPFTDNPCLGAELGYGHSLSGYAAYVNIDAPRSGDPAAYGREVALDSLARIARAHLVTPVLWLDVEVLNHWADPATNVAVINAALHTLQAHGVTAGIYSSPAMWQQIAGGARIGVPVWLATAVQDYHVLPSWCAQGLGGRAAEMAQYIATDGHQLVDVDVLCPSALPGSVRTFTAGRRTH